MTYEEIQKLNQEAQDIEQREREAVKAIRGDSEQRFFRLQEEQTRTYDLGNGTGWLANQAFKVSVNPVNGSVYIEQVQSFSPSLFPAAVWVAFAEVMVLFEDWKAGKVLHLPPSGDWDSARAWLKESAPPQNGVFR